MSLSTFVKSSVVESILVNFVVIDSSAVFMHVFVVVVALVVAVVDVVVAVVVVDVVVY